MKSFLWTMALTLVFVLIVSSSWVILAMAEELDESAIMYSNAIEMIPGVTAEMFNDALTGDRLSLRPSDITVDIDRKKLTTEVDRFNSVMAAFGDTEHMLSIDTIIVDQCQINEVRGAFFSEITYMSFSPSGQRMFIVTHGVPLVFDIQSGVTRLIAPSLDIDIDYYSRQLFDLLKKPEDMGVVWSKDERYISMSFLRKTLTAFSIGSNILFIDIDRGHIQPLLSDLPAKTDLSHDFDAPFRSVFDLNQPILYYQVYASRQDEHRSFTEIRSFNYETHETQQLIRYDLNEVSLDPNLWFCGNSFVTTVNKRSAIGGYGIKEMSPDEYNEVVCSLGADYDEKSLIDWHIIDMKEGRGVLHWYWDFAHSGLSSNGAMILFSLNNLSESMFAHGVGIRPDAIPPDRLISYDVVESVTSTSIIAEDIANDRLLIPLNAALSPDGRYVLFLATNKRKTPFMFIHDFEKGITGRVDFEYDCAPWYLAYYNMSGAGFTRGLRWLGGNRVIVASRTVLQLGIE